MFLFPCAYACAYVACGMLIAQVWTRLKLANAKAKAHLLTYATAFSCRHLRSRNEKAWKFKRALQQNEEPRRAKTLSNVKFLWDLLSYAAVRRKGRIGGLCSSACVFNQSDRVCWLSFSGRAKFQSWCVVKRGMAEVYRFQLHYTDKCNPLGLFWFLSASHQQQAWTTYMWNNNNN